VSRSTRAPGTADSANWDAYAARDEIRQVIATYFIGVGRCDWDLVRTCYHHDAIEEHGSFSGPADEFITWMSEGHVAEYAMTMICGIDPQIALEGDTADCVTYATVRHRSHADSRGVIRTDSSGGRLVDRMERRDGQWRIAHRELVLEWAEDDRPIGSHDPGHPSTLEAPRAPRARADRDSGSRQPPMDALAPYPPPAIAASMPARAASSPPSARRARRWSRGALTDSQLNKPPSAKA
jgi:hypothetical protein